MNDILEFVFDVAIDVIDSVIDFVSDKAFSNESEAGNYSLKELEAFYSDKKSNSDRLYISDMFELAKDDDWLENNHCFIQWLFPLNEKSNFNHNAPVLTKTQIAYLKDSAIFQETLESSFWIMMRFYGFEYQLQENNDAKFILTDITRAQKYWLKPFNHNQLRISRILNCLDLFERDDLASMLRTELKRAQDEFGIINDETISYWKL